jgi:hypothetical protein
MLSISFLGALAIGGLLGIQGSFECSFDLESAGLASDLLKRDRAYRGEENQGCRNTCIGDVIFDKRFPV